MAIAKAKGRLRGKQPKLKPTREAQLVALWREGKHTTLDLAEMFDVTRSTVYRAIQRAGAGASDALQRQSGAQPDPAPAKQRCENRATYRYKSQQASSNIIASAVGGSPIETGRAAARRGRHDLTDARQRFST